MDIYTDTIRDLTPADKLLLVERIWDDLAEMNAPIPLPSWALAEASRRLQEMSEDANFGLSHEDVWKRIDDARNA